MRLWSLNPVYLDVKGLVALWRESLLAQKVILGETRGYKRHPQLERFRAAEDSLEAMGSYLFYIELEARARGYSFDRKKILRVNDSQCLLVNRGQLDYEFNWLLKKLETRDLEKLEELRLIDDIMPHPSFKVLGGGVEPWEKSVSEP